MLTPRKKKIILKEHGAHETDTGSVPVQIGLLSKRIEELTEHLKKNRKDFSSRRGLLKLVGKRRRLLKYLETTNSKAYHNVVKKLEL